MTPSIAWLNVPHSATSLLMITGKIPIAVLMGFTAAVVPLIIREFAGGTTVVHRRR